jgi:hypothetical protein
VRVGATVEIEEQAVLHLASETFSAEHLGGRLERLLLFFDAPA